MAIAPLAGLDSNSGAERKCRKDSAYMARESSSSSSAFSGLPRGTQNLRHQSQNRFAKLVVDVTNRYQPIVEQIPEEYNSQAQRHAANHGERDAQGAGFDFPAWREWQAGATRARSCCTFLLRSTFCIVLSR